MQRTISENAAEFSQKNAEEQEFVRINGFESRWSDFSSDTGNLSWVASTTFDKGKEVKMIGRARILWHK